MNKEKLVILFEIIKKQHASPESAHATKHGQVRIRCSEIQSGEGRKPHRGRDASRGIGVVEPLVRGEQAGGHGPPPPLEPGPSSSARRIERRRSGVAGTVELPGGEDRDLSDGLWGAARGEGKP
jgi:hypothetical protein